MLGTGPGGADLLLKKFDVAFQLAADQIGFRYFVPDLRDQRIQSRESVLNVVILDIGRFILSSGGCEIHVRNLQVSGKPVHLFRHLMMLQEEAIDVCRLELFTLLQINSCLFGLSLQRADLLLQFLQNIRHADKVCLLIFKFFDRLFLAAFVFDNTGSLIEEFAPVFRFVGQNFIDLALSDDGVAFLADSGVIKQLIDITQSALYAVQQIFALAGPVDSSGNRDFLVIHGKLVVRIVQRNCHIGKAQRFSQLCSGKNNILHGCAAQLFDALFSEHPADRVRDIALSASVRSDDPRDSVVELKPHFVRKGFESLYFNALKIHVLTVLMPHQLQRAARRGLFGIFLGFSLSGSGCCPVDQHADCVNRRVGRALPVNKLVGNGSAFFLHLFLQKRLRIRIIQFLRILQNKLSYKALRLRHIAAAVQIDGADQGFRDVTQDGRLLSSASRLFSPAEPQIIGKSELFCDRRKSRLADKLCAQPGHLALPHVRKMLIKKRAGDHLQDSVSQKFQTFITGSVMFIDIGRMCHGTQKQGAVPEPVTDPLFQFCRCRLPCVPGTFHQAFSPSAP